MFAAPPVANLLVIRSSDIDRAVRFYQQMGMLFDRHSHGKGPEHFASDICGFAFEIYAQRNANDVTTNTRIGFSVDDVDGVIDLLREIDATIVTYPTDTEWGRRAVVKDLDGHIIELVTPVNREAKIVDNDRKTNRTGGTGDADMKDLQRFHADNNRNESQIDFVVGNCDGYESPLDFYAAAIRMLWDGWDSEQNTEKYIANSVQRERSIDELTAVVNECLAITPILDFAPQLINVESVHSFRDDWNVREFVWRSGNQYVFMSWDTAA
jgi:predicted enzyme related to lactoylglutathione lyase